VRDKSKTFYCYDEQEKQDAIKALRGKPEITRFKGLGEISIIENLKVELDQLKEDEVMNLDEDFEPTVSTEDIAKDIVG